MGEKNKIRKQVSEFYADSLSRGCGCDCGLGPAPPQGAAANAAGYTPEELTVLPSDAVANSFGCGNPLAFSDVKEGQTVLDLGSGAGIDLLIAAKKVGPTGKVIGVDMTGDMIERARANIQAAGYENIELRKGIIEDLPVDDASVDWVISNCVINLSPEKDKVFAEIVRVLKPGGRIGISDIVVKDLPDWVRESAALYGACVAGAVGEEEYLEGLRKAGLVEVEVAERLVYDKAQLKVLIESEIPKDTSTCCCGDQAPKELAAVIAEDLEGRIWSAKIKGRKAWEAVS